MKFLFGLGCLCILIWLFPYFRILIKRISLGVRLKALCRRKGYTLFPVRALPFLASNSARTCDFYIETPKEVLCVKLFAAKHKKSILKFMDKNRLYYFTNSLWLFSRWGQTTMTYDSKLHPLPIYDFQANIPPYDHQKSRTNILLIHPKCHEIHGIDENSQNRILAVGDTVCGMRLESGKTFLEHLQ